MSKKSPIKKVFSNLFKQDNYNDDLKISNDYLKISNDYLKICNADLKIHKDDLKKYKDDLHKCYENMDIESFKHQNKIDHNYYLQEKTNTFVKDLMNEILEKSNLIRLLIDENHSLRQKCKQQHNTDDLIESIKQSELHHKNPE